MSDIPPPIRNLLDIATDTAMSMKRRHQTIYKAPKVRTVPKNPSKAMLYQSRPGTLSWFYLGTYESYVQVALAFIEAPPDEELIPEEKKLLFKNYWRQLPKTKEEAKKFYERGLIEDL